MSFPSLGLSAAVARVACGQGFDVPTPIQHAAIPVILEGRDVLALAQTGSGKTAAFLLPVLHALLLGGHRVGARSGPRRLRALVLVPTRELALQVGEVALTLAEKLPGLIKVVAAHGGVSINPQMMALRGGADLVVATPGRLLDLVDQRAVSLSDVQTLVLDEADRLLDLGFAEELTDLLDLMPAQRQSLFFSATFPEPVERLAQSMLQDPVLIEIPDEPRHTPDIAQRAVVVDAAQRVPLLRHLVKDPAWSRVLVFVATRYGAELVAHKLHRVGIRAAAFHADLSQGARREVLHAFKSGDLQVVVATDVAARGLHIDDLPVVVNFDLPRSADDHVHRIGRTGRAGASGLAVSFVTPERESHFRLIEKRQGLAVLREEIAGFEPSFDAASPTPSPQGPQGLDPQGGVKGWRKSKKDKLREAARLAETPPGRPAHPVTSEPEADA